ncbi:hypothetical protein WA026_021320 [Henosepilachna vigintioctopunctata]|uniref:Uncharacterized protein n=1 Tax=Henosepilachna vigintioctopunctata TaxID=420089 RepID=A0AAW1U6Y6_9CUCU
MNFILASDECGLEYWIFNLRRSVVFVAIFKDELFEEIAPTRVLSHDRLLNPSITSLNSAKSCTSKGLAALTIRPVGHLSPILYTTAAIIDKITDRLPVAPVSDCILDKFKNLRLAYPSFNIPGHIDILLSADMFAKILIDGHVSDSSGIGAFNSIFADEHRLSEIPKILWEIESVPQVDTPSPTDNICEAMFN